MYPTDNLAALQRQKLWRIQRSAELRGEITSACATLAYPVGVAEQVIATVKKFAPYLSFASFFFRKKSAANVAASAKGAFGAVLRWAPTVFSAIKIFRASRQSNTTTSSHASS